MGMAIRLGMSFTLRRPSLQLSTAERPQRLVRSLRIEKVRGPAIRKDYTDFNYWIYNDGRGYIGVADAEPANRYHTRKTISRVAIRDACRCGKCVDPHSGQKTFGTTDIPDELPLKGYSRLEDGGLEVIWDKDFLTPAKPHVSRYTSSQVRSWFTGRRPRWTTPERPRRVLWDAKTFAASPFMAKYDDWMSDDVGFHDAFAQLWKYGLLVIDGVPHDEQSVIRLANRIGPLQETFYGRTWDVRSKPQAENIAYTNSFLGLHQDLLYLDQPPRIQFLHCLENGYQGGESLFSDAYRASALMHLGPQKHVMNLEKQQIRYEYKMHGHHYENTWPVLKPEDGKWHSVHWSPPFQASDQTEAKEAGVSSHMHWQKAAKIFRTLLEDEEWVFELKLKPGQCVVFDNLRVLHGRRSFDTSSGGPTGGRWLRGTYIGDDAWKSKSIALAPDLMAAATRANSRPPKRITEQAMELLKEHGVWPKGLGIKTPPGVFDAEAANLD